MSDRPRKAVRTALIAAGFAAAMAAATFTAAAQPSADPAQADALPSSFAWESTGALVAPQDPSDRDLVSIKDPSVVEVDGEYHVYATTADTQGRWSMTYFGGFSDWSRAGSAPQYHLSQTAIGDRYAAAPQVFYFEPRDEWYLIYQTGLPSYSLLSDPSRPQSATAPSDFMSAYPPIVTDNAGSGGYVVDHWITCDDVKCYMFYNNDNNYFFRSETTVEEFPNGFGDTVVVMSDPGNNRIFEAVNVYRVGDSGEYLMMIEGIGSDGRRYFNSWTADSLDAIGNEWTPLAASESNPFARADNVTFPQGAWTQDISHGELIRDGYDQTLTIDPCDLQFLYQGMDPGSSGDYSQLPWKLGLLTQTDSGCEAGEEPTEEPTAPGTGEGGCTAEIEVVGDWGSGWQGRVTVTAGSAAISGWELDWSWPGSQRISSAWNGDWSQSGSTVTASDVGWNGAIAAGQSDQSFGFIAGGPSSELHPSCSAT
ncbi:non-reducing end alpha-L-arabinofuranosidase family hydrolase [Glycomyces tarimensis]